VGPELDQKQFHRQVESRNGSGIGLLTIRYGSKKKRLPRLGQPLFPSSVEFHQGNCRHQPQKN
jgi:hypothetical protein